MKSAIHGLALMTLGHLVLMAEESGNGGGSTAAQPWVAGQPRITETQPAPGQIGISPSSVPVPVADPAVFRVPRTDEPVNPVPERETRVAEAPRLHAVEGRDRWGTLPLTTVLAEQRMINQQIKYPVTGVSTDKASASVKVGATNQITATAQPANAVQSFVWTSSDPTKATVDQTGKVTGVAVGSATVTATSQADPSKKATVAVTVAAA